MKHVGIALFDYDGTIAQGDSIVPYILYSIRKGFAPPSTAFRAAFAYLRYYLRRLDDIKAKEESLIFLKGKSKADSDAFAKQFAQNVLKKGLYPQAIAAIEECKREGLHVIIVSASPDVYMQETKNLLGVQGVIATRCALDEKDVYLGEMASKNCKGFEKTLRIAEYLAAHGIEPDMDISRSFGDSMSDLPMLRLTRKPTLVNGKRKTRKVATDMTQVIWKK